MEGAGGVNCKLLTIKGGYYKINVILSSSLLPRRNGNVLVSTLDSGTCARGSSPDRGHCVVFLGRILYCHGASLHPCVKMGTGEHTAVGNPAMD